MLYNDIAKNQQGLTPEQLATQAQAATLPAPITPRQPNQSITDYTNSFDAGKDYAFTSEQDFYSKTGQKDFSGVEEVQQGKTPTSDLYKYAGNPTVYQKAQTPTPKTTPVVGTSDAERAAQRRARIAEIKNEANGGLTPPTPYKSLDEFNALREQQGVVQDEQELASIQNEARVAKEQLNQFKQTNSEGMSEGGYLGTVSEAERNLNFRTDSLALREQAVVDRLNTKNAYINNVVKLGAQDYQNAYTEYTNEYNKNVKAIELYNQDLDNQQKDALTGLTTLNNLLKDKNVDLSSLDATTQAQIQTLALKAGLPSGVVEQIMTAQPNAEIASIQKNDDGTTTVLYKQNGKISGMETYGTPGQHNNGTGGTVTERLLANQQSILSKARNLQRGENGFANPNDYLDKASEYIGASGTPADFLAAISPERYLSESDAKWVREQLTGKKTNNQLDPAVSAFLGLQT